MGKTTYAKMAKRMSRWGVFKKVIFLFYFFIPYIYVVIFDFYSEAS